MKQHDAVLADGVLDKEHTLLAIFPSPMMYAGPTEVQWHARARRTAGADFYIVGRDPAGMSHPARKGDLYNPDHGRSVPLSFFGFAPAVLIPLTFSLCFTFLPQRGAAAGPGTRGPEDHSLPRGGLQPPEEEDGLSRPCPPRGVRPDLRHPHARHGQGMVLILCLLFVCDRPSCQSSTDQISLLSPLSLILQKGELPPDGFMSPAGWKVLSDYYRSLEQPPGYIQVQ